MLLKKNNLTIKNLQYTIAIPLSVDPKKGISIVYNVLNKTERININSAVGRFINYTYDGSGVLLRKQQYDNSVLQKTTDYIDGFVYENSTLTYFGMAEGRVRNTGSSLKPEYVITDFQGNARVSFEEQNGQAVLRQENSYYPFGLVMPGGLLPTEPNKQLYNGGSEWQNDFADLPDYFSTFYRNYDPALGRFIAVDPLAQENESISPYNYALNNPIRFNDPMGDISRDVTPNELFGGGGGGYGGTWTRVGGITWFTSDTDAFGAGVEYLDATNGWGYTLPGNFDTAWTRLHENRTGKEKEDGGTALRVVHIKETKTNKNWLIERLDDANQGGVLNDAWDWAVANREKLIATGGALANGYAGVTEIAGGSALMAAPTGVTQIAGGYLIADGATRIATSAVNIYGIWSGNQSAKNAPHNVLGLASMAVTSNQKTQQLFQLGGDFGLSRQNLINLANGGFTNVFSAGQGAWQVIRPYKDAYTNFKK